MKKFFLCAFLFLSFAAPAFALEPPVTLATQAYMVDYDTGTVLYDKGADVKMPTSSMSKVLTTIVVMEAIKQGRISWDQEFPVSEKAWRTQGSKMFVDINKPVSVRDLMHGVVIQSGNDACIVLAEGIAGTEDAFAELLNQEAVKIGMKNSHFMNASGLPDDNHYSTPRDLAIMAAYLIKNFPDEYKLHAIRDFTYNNIKQGNRNPLLYDYPGADGVKTGHTEIAGYGLIGSAVMNGRRVIMVINGTKNMQERADESRKLMDWGLRNFKNIDVAKKGQVYAQAPVVLGKMKTVDLTVAADSKMTLPALGSAGGVKIQAVYNAPLKAPVKVGDVAGKLVIQTATGAKSEVPLIAKSNVEQSGFFARAIEKLMLRIVGTPK